MITDLTVKFTPENIARETAIATAEILSQAVLEMADWKEPMDNANEDLQTRLAAVKKAWQEENAELIQDYEKASAKFSDADKTHRQAIIALYESQADKSQKSNLIPGWGVAVSEEIESADPSRPLDDAAIEWLIEHNHREALKLDAVKFKKLAEVLKPSFVTFRPKVTAKINPLKGGKS